MKVDLSAIRNEILSVIESRRDKEGPPGCYRWLPGGRTNLYSSLDAAIAYSIMGIDSDSLGEDYRIGWINHINSYADDYAKDGRYKDILSHQSPFHSNGMVIGALGYLDGKQVFPIKFYDAFDSPEKIQSWLENADWPRQWAFGFWGGPLMFSTSKRCSVEWIDSAINWLDENIDENTGMWRKNVKPENKYHPLGGFVHIYPIYELHKRFFAYPDKVIDSVHNLQTPSGNWYPNDPFSYLDMDALYAYAAMLKRSNIKRETVRKSTLKYADFLIQLLNQPDIYDKMTMHGLLCLVSTFGLLNQLLPDIFEDTVRWSDIFSARLLYRTDLVEPE